MKKMIQSILKRFRSFFCSPILSYLERQESNRQALLQNMLKFQYKQMVQADMQMPSFEDVGFKTYSEADEDGILHYIFALIGTTNKRLLDIGAAGINISNTANLVINHGWKGLLIEGDLKRVLSARKFYETFPNIRNYPPVVVDKWVTSDNVNQVIMENGFSGDIDLLSIDIDGVDYWIWDAINCMQPRVVIVEYQCIWGPEKSVTVPNSPDFKPEYHGRFGIYSGASLAAFVKLGKRKGYRLVGCSRYGYNAFFIQNGIGEEFFPEIPAKDCFKHPFTHWARKKFLNEIEELEWVEV